MRELRYSIIDDNAATVLATDSLELTHQLIEHSDLLTRTGEWQLPFTVMEAIPPEGVRAALDTMNTSYPTPPSERLGRLTSGDEELLA